MSLYKSIDQYILNLGNLRQALAEGHLKQKREGKFEDIMHERLVAERLFGKFSVIDSVIDDLNNILEDSCSCGYRVNTRECETWHKEHPDHDGGE